ncbi:hypothetical protein HMI54_003103 [Coelomomyces lativittatus]|nr:hypothetical protein HMI56_004591 [Coelomomyces lativittatus]KAJ1516931.1 hypothetical protein HMI55_001036 [Coelomomyces lativittatus]KAJ1517999.1 hypothetical protein HMI54_003103 [Coelomomyces lativittatus]
MLSKPYQLAKKQLDLQRVLKEIFSASHLPWLYQTVKCKDLEEGWIPLTELLRLKKIRGVGGNINVLLATIRHTCMSFLELDPSSFHVRKKNTSFEHWQPPSNPCVLHVSGLPSDFSLSDAKTYFESFGALTWIRPCKENPDTVWILYATEDNANHVFTQPHYYNGQLMYIEFKENPFSKPKLKTPSTALSRTLKKPFDYVPGCLLQLSEIPKSVTLLDIKSFFSSFGTLHSVHPSATTTWLRYMEPLAHQVHTLLFPNHVWISTDPKFCATFQDMRVACVNEHDEKNFYFNLHRRQKSKQATVSKKKKETRETKKKRKQIKLKLKKNKRKIKLKKKNGLLLKTLDRRKQPRELVSLHSSLGPSSTSSLNMISECSIIDPLVMSLENTKVY